MWFQLLHYRLQNLKGYFKTGRPAKIVTVGLFLLVLTAVAVGVYLFAREGFYYVSADPYFKDALSLYVYEVYLLIISFLVLFNTLIVGFFGLFRGKNDDWLLASPRFSVFPDHILVRSYLSSLWPLAVIALPALWAVRTVFGLAVWQLAVSLLAVAVLTDVIVMLVLGASLFFAVILARAGKIFNARLLTFRKLTTVLLLLSLFTVVSVWHAAINRDLIKIFHAQNVEISNTSADIASVSAPFKYLPSHWAALHIYAWQTHQTFAAWWCFFALTILLILFRELWHFASARFLPIWQILHEGSFIAGASGRAGRTRFRRSYRFRGGPIKSLAAKEALVTMRNGRGLIWFAFLFFVWLAQTGVNIVLARNIARYQVDIGGLAGMAQVLQLVTAAYFTSAFVLRFVFPAFSSERRTAWILASAPVNFRKVFWAKLSFYLPALVIIGLAAGYTNLIFLHLPLADAGLTLILFLSAIIFIISLGYSLGALFPNFSTDDPSVLSTTLPGLAFIFGSLFYGFWGGFLLFRALPGHVFSSIFIYCALSLIMSLVLLLLAASKVGKRDFVKNVGIEE